MTRAERQMTEVQRGVAALLVLVRRAMAANQTNEQRAEVR